MRIKGQKDILRDKGHIKGQKRDKNKVFEDEEDIYYLM